jgi:hypothetical protein
LFRGPKIHQADILIYFGGAYGVSISRRAERRRDKGGNHPVCPATRSQEQPMRFMIIVKATDDSEAETSPAPDEALLAEMADYHEQLARAGVLLDGSGLKPSSQGWRIRYKGGQRTVIDGPFAETKELIAGYTLIQVKSREEAMEWARRFPNPAGTGKPAEIEVRPLYELEDFGQSEAVQRFRDLCMGGEPAR